MKLLIIGTHPCHTTGYSRVMTSLIKGILELSTDIELTVFGIQQYYKTTEDTRTFMEHPRLNIYNVVEYDEADYGYGTKTLKQFLDISKPDKVIIYNDIYVSGQYIKIIEQSNVNPQIVVYLDQIYKIQDPSSVSFFNNHVDHIVVMSEYWKEQALLNGLQEPITPVRHCIDPPPGEDRSVARSALNMDARPFIFLNLNRNQTRKRLDLTVQGYVKFLKKNPDANTILLFGNIHDDTYDLQGIFNYECLRHGVPNASSKFMLNTSRLTDQEVTLLYCACDVGINTAQGEGYGLCNYEHAWYGKPQIVSHIGGLKDWFNEDNSIPLKPVVEIHGTKEQGSIRELGEIISPDDLADAMERYYKDTKLYDAHAKERPPVGWTEEIKKLLDVIYDV